METDHADAWDLAHFKQENSNLARCYIDLRNVVRSLLSDAGRNEPLARLEEIERTVSDGTVKIING